MSYSFAKNIVYMEFVSTHGYPISTICNKIRFVALAVQRVYRYSIPLYIAMNNISTYIILQLLGVHGICKS